MKRNLIPHPTRSSQHWCSTILVTQLVLVNSNLAITLQSNLLFVLIFFAWGLLPKGQSINGTSVVFSPFMINSFYIFFLVRKQHENLYTMTEIAAMDAFSSLADLYMFALLKNLDVLPKVSCCFWNHCNVSEPLNFESSDTGDGFVVPISNFMLSLISHATNPAAWHHDIEYPVCSHLLLCYSLDFIYSIPYFSL